MPSLNKKSTSWLQRLAIKAILGYRACRPAIRQINLTVFGFNSECKQNPTCSEYAIQAVTKHGTIAGLFLSLKRISQCH